MAGGRPEDGNKVLQDAKEVQLAILAVSGMNKTSMAKKLNVSIATVDRMMQRDEFINTVRKLEAEALATAKSRIRIGTAKLADKVLNVINQHLDNGNLQAIAPALKILGLGEGEVEVNDTQITVVLPTGAHPVNVTPKKDIEI